jgi:hypothetical protein
MAASSRFPNSFRIVGAALLPPSRALGAMGAPVLFGTVAVETGCFQLIEVSS